MEQDRCQCSQGVVCTITDILEMHRVFSQPACPESLHFFFNILCLLPRYKMARNTKTDMSVMKVHFPGPYSSTRVWKRYQRFGNVRRFVVRIRT
jgi:hypothetical protein